MTSSTAGWRKFVLIPLCALMLVAGCAGNRDKEKQQRLARLAPQTLYDQGKKALRTRDFAEAVAVFEALNARYPFTPQSRQARIDVIYAYYKLGEKESAKDAAETFIRENPTHPRIDYAWYLQGLIDFERTPYAVERWLNVNLADRPPQSARDSFTSLRTVVTRFPTSAYAHDARRRMVYLRNRLADYEMRVSGYYMERGAWVAAAQRARQTIEEYDGAPAMKDALRVMLYCYGKLEYKDLADNTRKVFLENFPDESPEMPSKKGPWWKLWS
jgi:outer membrane protein assembly factor BamD